MDTVYIETTIVGHLAGRLHPSTLIAARQELTRQWWSLHSTEFRLFVSELVRSECSGGDSAAAQERLELIETLESLEIDDAVRELARKLMAAGAIPFSEPRDAFHVAIAAVHGVQYLLTWNFAHIANAASRGKIEAVCRDTGCEPPIICTPEELAGEEDNDQISDG
jgi:hypothetical protein